MADNTQLNPGSGGDVIKTEDIGGYKLAVSKIYLGARGVDGGPITAANPLPVAIGNFPATQAVSGSVGVSNFPATQVVSGSVGVSNFPATQVVSGSVGVSNFPATQAISASSLPLPGGAAIAAKQPALGTAGTSATDVLTVQGIASMTALKVDGSSVTQPVSGSVGVSNFPATQAVSGSVGVSNFPATQAVSGSVGVSNFPATQAVSGSVGVSNFPATQVISASSLPLPGGAAIAAKQPALGTAGTSATDVLTVQGIASMTALKVDGSSVTQPVSGSVGVSNFPATQAVSGTVGISGTVSSNANLMVASSAVTGANPVPVSNMTALPTGTNTIGSVIAQLATGILVNGTTSLTPKFASIAASATGDNTLVAAVTGKKLRVLKYTVVTSGAVSTKFRSSSGTDLTGAMSLASNSGIGGAFCPVGLFESIAGDALVLNLSAAIPVAGHLTYVEV